MPYEVCWIPSIYETFDHVSPDSTSHISYLLPVVVLKNANHTISQFNHLCFCCCIFKRGIEAEDFFHV